MSYWSLILQTFDKALQNLQPKQGSVQTLKSKLAWRFGGLLWSRIKKFGLNFHLKQFN